MNIIITNNKAVYDKYSEKINVEYKEIGFLKLLEYIRNNIHNGDELLTHPLSSSLKPNETPYKSVVVSRNKNRVLDLKSLNIIENSIETTKKFLKDKGTPNWEKKSLKDFEVIDLSVIDEALMMKLLV